MIDLKPPSVGRPVESQALLEEVRGARISFGGSEGNGSKREECSSMS